nr:chlorophyll a/b binding protein domain-containing protein [Tanacetum cinerariifolium]
MLSLGAQDYTCSQSRKHGNSAEMPYDVSETWGNGGKRRGTSPRKGETFLKLWYADPYMGNSTYNQHAELDSSVDDPPIPPRISSQQNQQHTPITNPFINSSSSSMPQGFRPDQSDQPSKNYIFSNALSSPVRRSLQNYHISQEGYVVKNNDHQDSSMDMHADSTGHDSSH